MATILVHFFDHLLKFFLFCIIYVCRLLDQINSVLN